MKHIVITLIATLFLMGSANCEELITALTVKDPSGKTVEVMLDACYDPVTKRWGPCYVVSPTCLNKLK